MFNFILGIDLTLWGALEAPVSAELAAMMTCEAELESLIKRKAIIEQTCQKLTSEGKIEALQTWHLPLIVLEQQMIELQTRLNQYLSRLTTVVGTAEISSTTRMPRPIIQRLLMAQGRESDDVALDDLHLSEVDSLEGVIDPYREPVPDGISPYVVEETSKAYLGEREPSQNASCLRADRDFRKTAPSGNALSKDRLIFLFCGDTLSRSSAGSTGLSGYESGCESSDEEEK